jgi:hypothetical protein
MNVGFEEVVPVLKKSLYSVKRPQLLMEPWIGCMRKRFEATFSLNGTLWKKSFFLIRNGMAYGIR